MKVPFPLRHFACSARAVAAGVLALFWGASFAAAGDPIPGRMAEWALSRPVRVSAIDRERYPDAAVQKAAEWVTVESDASGLVDIALHWQPLPGGVSKAFARTTLHAERAETRAFAFGFSEGLSIYVNGRVVYRGENRSRAADIASHGSNALACDHTVWLPLETGDNELLLAVTCTAGDWGFVARDLDAVFVHRSLSRVWEVTEGLQAPESVAYDRERRVLYVSDFAGDCISKVSLDGKLLAPAWASGLKRPTGVAFSHGKLYVIERAGLAEIDPERGAVVRRQRISGAGFANDLAVTDDGEVYVTDVAKGRLYKITADQVELWLEDPAIAQVNGLLAEPARLLVGVTSDGAIKTVDLATKRIERFITVGSGALMDGLVSDGRGGYLFSDYFGRIFHADAAGRRTLLLDGTGPREFCADFAYVVDEGLLVVPSLYGQALTAFRFDREKL